jgi:hypothetical protein
MRNYMVCDITLHPSTVVSEFEEAMVDDVLPHARDPLQHPDSLFVRSLYAEAEPVFPPTYRCVVDSIWVTDRGFFGIRDKARELGADVGENRFRHMFGSLPGLEEALVVERSGRARSAVMLEVHLPFGAAPEASFEQQLAAALADEVGVATRVNNVYAAFWTRDDTVVLHSTEYVVAALGDFMQPQLRKDTIEQIEAAGGRVVRSKAYHLLHTEPGPDPGLSSAPAAGAQSVSEE